MTGDAPSPGQGPGPADAGAARRRWRCTGGTVRRASRRSRARTTSPSRSGRRCAAAGSITLTCSAGRAGCGKTSSARILARSLNCEQGPTPDPCGVCASCVALAPAGPGSIDVIEIDAASHGGVDDARDLRERAFYAPVSGRYKIYIIDEAHMVTREGFNALLKLVEEPPPHLKFVFATTEPEKVIATIRSRTHHYPFRLVPPAVLRELLEQILASEGVHLRARGAAGGDPGRARARSGTRCRCSTSSSPARTSRGCPTRGPPRCSATPMTGCWTRWSQAFGEQDGAAVFGAIDRVVEAGHDPRRFAADLLDRLRDLIVLAAVPDAPSTGLLDIPADRLDGMRAQAGGFGPGRAHPGGGDRQRGPDRDARRHLAPAAAGADVRPGAPARPRARDHRARDHRARDHPVGGTGGDAELRARLDRLERRLESALQAGAACRRAGPGGPPGARRAPGPGAPGFRRRSSRAGRAGVSASGPGRVARPAARPAAVSPRRRPAARAGSRPAATAGPVDIGSAHRPLARHPGGGPRPSARWPGYCWPAPPSSPWPTTR